MASREVTAAYNRYVNPPVDSGLTARQRRRMGRRARNRDFDQAEIITKMVLGILALLALSAGSVTGFAQAFVSLVTGLLTLVVIVSIIGAVGWVGWRLIARRRQPAAIPVYGWQGMPSTPTSARCASGASSPVVESSRFVPVRWPEAAIEKALAEIDWYQFEKFCSALLRSEGFQVERKGGAQADGGVDIIAEKGGDRILVQCKHWRTWSVQEKVVREMLGSMTHHGVMRGAIYTLKGWTVPAGRFAGEHQITVADSSALARRAADRLTTDQLDEILRARGHQCPKCDAPMVERTGNFKPFWGCSKFPRCRRR
jgi:restriction system protein